MKIRPCLVAALIAALAGCSAPPADTTSSPARVDSSAAYDGSVFHGPDWPDDASGRAPGLAANDATGSDAAISSPAADAATTVTVTSDAGSSAMLADALAPCSDDTTCPADRFCQRASGLCEGDGTCVLRPRVCDEAYHPVCGCDGLTYANACDAAMHGRTVSASGACGT